MKDLLSRRIRGMLVLLLLCEVIGLHFAAAQVAAWSLMVSNDVPAFGMKAALLRIATGEKPCVYCKSIRKAKEGRSGDFARSLLVSEFLAVLIAAPATNGTFPSAAFVLLQGSLPDRFGSSPPTPPPLV